MIRWEKEFLVRSGIPPATQVNLSAVSASQYPYLRLRLNISDGVNRTAAQLKSWLVTYVPLPEGTLQPDIAYHFPKDTLQEGDSLRFEIAFQNISPTPMDSVDYQFVLNPGTTESLFIGKADVLLPDSVLMIRKVLSTKGLAGKNQLALSVNPGGKKTGTITAEQLYHPVFLRKNGQYQSHFLILLWMAVT